MTSSSFRGLGFALIIFCSVLALSSEEDASKNLLKPRKSLTETSRNFYPFYERAARMGGLRRYGPTLPDLVMYGLAGIPILRAFQYVAPFIARRNQNYGNKKKPKRDLTSHSRNKRDLTYLKSLLELLLSVERALEKYGVTEPQCQLRATCEIHRRSKGGIVTKSERNFIKLVSEMRREMENPRIEPMAKYVFAYYKGAAIRGEKQYDCGKIYYRCPHSLDFFEESVKSKTKPPVHQFPLQITIGNRVRSQ